MKRFQNTLSGSALLHSLVCDVILDTKRDDRLLGLIGVLSGTSMSHARVGGGGGGVTPYILLYFVWYRRAAGIPPFFQVIYTSYINRSWFLL